MVTYSPEKWILDPGKNGDEIYSPRYTYIFNIFSIWEKSTIFVILHAGVLRLPVRIVQFHPNIHPQIHHLSLYSTLKITLLLTNSTPVDLTTPLHDPNPSKSFLTINPIKLNLTGSMNTCMNACMHESHTCIYHMHMYTLMHSYIGCISHACIYTCMYSFMHHMHIYMHTFIRSYIACMHKLTYTCIHPFIHAWIHIQLYTCM